jgi:hypothetical protein
MIKGANAAQELTDLASSIYAFDTVHIDQGGAVNADVTSSDTSATAFQVVSDVNALPDRSQRAQDLDTSLSRILPHSLRSLWVQ